MPDAPLSRRARRSFEEEAADRAASQDPTLAFARGVASGEIEAVDSDGVVISRRDRRRMERLAHPLEAWTAEEEMIATGQIPAMTPERIAEHERISREKAERAAQEAAAASQEFRRLAEAEIRRVQAPVVVAPAAPPAWAEAAPTDFPGDVETASEPARSEPALPEQVLPVQAVAAVQAQPEFVAPAFVEPAFVEPEPAAPAFVAPAFVEPAFVEPEPAAPAFVAPAFVEPEPAAPAFVEPAFVEPAPAAPAFVEPAFVEPEPAAPAFVEPAAPLANVDADTVPDSSDAGTHVVNPVLEAYQPTMALDAAPLARVVHPVHEDTPAPEGPIGADSLVAERPNIFDELFPPGSNQAMLRQQDPFANGSREEQLPAESGQIPTLLPPQEVTARTLSPVEEMRRLAEEAMSGIERAARADEAAAAAAAAAVAATAAAPGPDPSVAAEFDSLPSVSSQPVAQVSGAPIAQQAPAKGGALAEFSWNTEGGGGPSAIPAQPEPTFDSIPGMPRGVDPAPTTPPGGLAPHQAGFDQLVRPASGQFPMPGQQGQPASGQFPMPGQQGQPASGQFPMPGQQPGAQGFPSAPQGLGAPMGPAWNSPPASLTSSNGVDANDFTPLSNVPTPDFSGLYQQGQAASFPPITGGINTSGFTTTDPSSTGQVSAVRRPDLPEVGGAKHFKWLHLAVIGALMFVLGVVIYNAAFAS